MGRTKALMAGALAAAAVAAALLPAAGAGGTTKASSPLQQGVNYYRGRTITFISQGAAGGTLDLWARAIAPYLGAYLKANVNVEDLSAGNGIQAQDAIAGAAPNGLTVGWISAVGDIGNTLLRIPGLNFNPARLAFIGASGPNDTAFIASTTSPYTNWKSVADSATPVKILDDTAGASDFWIRAITGVFKVPTAFITGYGNNAALINGFSRGDGPVAMLPLSDDLSLIQGGKARPLMVLDPLPKGSAASASFVGVPTLAQLLQQSPPKTKQLKLAAAALGDLANGLNNPMLAAPTATPPDEVTALRAAFKWAADNKACIQGMLAAGLGPGYIPGEQLKASYLNALKVGRALIPFIAH